MDFYIFNELSIRPFADIYEAREKLKNFIRTCAKVRELGFQTLRLHESIENPYQLQIAPNYKVSQWLKDSEVEDDLKDNFRDIIFYSPLINDEEPIAKEQNTLSEFKNSDCLMEKKQLFEKHIKTGDLRFHFYPDEESNTIYVGYIGSHLSTVKFK